MTIKRSRHSTWRRKEVIQRPSTPCWNTVARGLTYATRRAKRRYTAPSSTSNSSWQAFFYCFLYYGTNNHLQQQQLPFNGRLSGTTRVGRYQKKHSPAHTHPGQRTSFITFLHLQRSMASSLFSLRA